MKRLVPQNRAGTWYLIRRVPKAYQHLDKRTFVKLTTGIRVENDPKGGRAALVVAELNLRLEQEWDDLAAGKDPNGARDYERARATAINFGLPYVTARQLAVDPAEIIRRLELLERSQMTESPKVVAAVLGGVAPPEFRLSGLLERYKGEQAASLVDMSPRQLEAWEANKKRALRVAIEVLGDKAARDLTRDDGVALRKAYQKRVIAREIAIRTANAEMSHFIKMLRVVEMEARLGIPVAAFEDLRIEGGKSNQRPPFDTDFIQNKLLAEGALDGLDPEARRILLVMVDTGMRPSEIVNLSRNTIHLNAPVPYVSIEAEGRRLKTDPSEREIPLVGCALAAMRLQPDGFPTYFDQSDILSNVVNAYLKVNGLRPTPKHTLYGLRHSFEDRLTPLDPPDKIIGRFMGHKQYREKYGTGPTLEHLHSWISRIALVPPASI